jgi:hypothetical protein
MRISFGKDVMKSKANLVVVVAAMALVSCSVSSSSKPDQPAVTKLDKPFTAGGSIEMQVEGGDYTIRVGSDAHIRVSFAGDPGSATAMLEGSDTHAKLTIGNTPHNNFRAVVEVPATADLTVHLSGGNLEVGAISGNKDIDAKAGNVGIAIPNSNDYGTVDASVKVGNLSGGPFGDSSSGLSPHLKWSGPGKYTLHASLGAGNLELKR